MPGARTKTATRVRKSKKCDHAAQMAFAQAQVSSGVARPGFNPGGTKSEEPIADNGWQALRGEDFWPKLRNQRFWLDRHDRFAELPLTLCALWVAADARWTIHGSTPEASGLFESEALLAVGELRELYGTSNSDPLAAWLDLLKSNRHYCLPINETACQPGPEVFRGTGGRILCLPKAAAACCMALANQAQRNTLASQALARDAIQDGPTGAGVEQIRHSRAQTVASLIKELDSLRPQMLEAESEYEVLRKNYPGYLAFRIAGERPDLKMKILAIRGSSRHIRLAQELAAAHYGKSLATIQNDWKRSKPKEFRRQS